MNWSGRLYRDRENGLFLGVCAGLAECFDVRVSALRVLTVIALVLMFWPVLFVYLTAAFLLHDRPLRYRGREPEERFWRSGGCESERWS